MSFDANIAPVSRTVSLTTAGTAPIAGNAILDTFNSFMGTLDKIYKQAPEELVTPELEGKNTSEIRDSILETVGRIAASLSPDEGKLACIGGDWNRFVIGGKNIQGIVDSKILASRAIDAYIKTIA